MKTLRIPLGDFERMFQAGDVLSVQVQGSSVVYELSDGQSGVITHSRFTSQPRCWASSEQAESYLRMLNLRRAMGLIKRP